MNFTPGHSAVHKSFLILYNFYKRVFEFILCMMDRSDGIICIFQKNKPFSAFTRFCCGALLHDQRKREKWDLGNGKSLASTQAVDEVVDDVNNYTFCRQHGNIGTC